MQVLARTSRTAKTAVAVARVCWGREGQGELKVKPQEDGVERKTSVVTRWVSSLVSGNVKGPSLGTPVALRHPSGNVGKVLDAVV